MAVVANGGGGSNGFFGIIRELGGTALRGVNEGLQTAIPIWTARQFDEQTADQLRSITFDGAFSMPRIDGQPLTPAQNQTARPPVQNAGLLFDNVSVNAAGIGIVMAGIIAVLVLARAN